MVEEGLHSEGFLEKPGLTNVLLWYRKNRKVLGRVGSGGAGKLV